MRPSGNTEGRRDDLGGLAGAAEVGTVHDGGGEPAPGQHIGAISRLLQAFRGELRVEPALPAFLDVPFRFAVADDQEVLHGWLVNQNRRSGPAGLTPNRLGTKLDRSV
jgi:hypothetical protein